MPDINEIIILSTLFVIYAVFLAYDLFRKEERYGYLAYVVAVVPVNYLWSLGPDYVLSAYIILFILFDITLIRDTYQLYMKDKRDEKAKEINEIILFLLLAIIVQLILTAIIPEVNTKLQSNTEKVGYFWLPNIHSVIFDKSLTLAFKLVATFMILLIIIPLLLDIKDEDIPFPVFIIIIALFIIPFLYLSYIWLPNAVAVLTFLFSTILFIVLLLITRSGK